MQTLPLRLTESCIFRISFSDVCNQDRNYRACSGSTFFPPPPHQPNSWTQLKAALLQAFSAGAGNGIVSGGMGGGGRWGVMVGAACVYCLFAATHTKTDEAQQLALMRVG